jgi:hypothetical protein
MRNWILMALIAALFAVVIAGCGGGTSGGASLTGRVVDGGSGSPIQGVRVALGTANANSAADGGFTLTGVALGSGILTAQMSGYEVASVPVTVTAGSNTLPVDVNMAPLTGDPPGESPRTIAGTIKLSNGSNASGVTVTLLSGASQYDHMTTGADGRYYFWAPAGTYTVRASKSGLPTKDQQVTVSDLTKVVTQDLTLQ